MKAFKFVIGTASFVMLCLVCVTAFAQNYKYDANVVLDGVLATSTADPAITYDEKPHQFPALKLRKPIAVLCNVKETDCQPEAGITLIQLVLKQNNMTQFKKLKGKSVKLSGTLFHSHTGHHFTSVLMDVESISSFTSGTNTTTSSKPN